MALLLNANDSVSRSYSITKPSPLHPIIPSECGERTGNLFDQNATDTNNGYDNTGRYLTNTGATGGNAGGTWRISEYIPIEPNAEYRLSGFTTGVNPSYCLYDANKDFISGTRYGSESVLAITTPSNARYLRFSRNINTDDVTMLVEGSTVPISYIPYGYKLPLTSAGQSVDIYLGESQTTRQIKKLVLTGEENWRTVSSPNYTYAVSITPYLVDATAISSHFIQRRTLQNLTNKTFMLANGSELYMKYNDKTSVNDFKQFLADQYANGTPVTVWYILANEETGTLNEPLRKIGNYADIIESTQTSAQIPTSAGSTTISWAGEGLAPSEVEFEYERV